MDYTDSHDLFDLSSCGTWELLILWIFPHIRITLNFDMEIHVPLGMNWSNFSDSLII